MALSLHADPGCPSPGATVAISGTSTNIGGSPARRDTILIGELTPGTERTFRKILIKTTADFYGNYIAFISIPGPMRIRALSLNTAEYSPIIDLCGASSFALDFDTPANGNQIVLGVIASLIAGAILLTVRKGV